MIFDYISNLIFGMSRYLYLNKSDIRILTTSFTGGYRPCENKKSFSQSSQSLQRIIYLG
jgi:hypothetical protein